MKSSCRRLPRADPDQDPRRFPTPDPRAGRSPARWPGPTRWGGSVGESGPPRSGAGALRSKKKTQQAGASIPTTHHPNKVPASAPSRNCREASREPNAVREPLPDLGPRVPRPASSWPDCHIAPGGAHPPPTEPTPPPGPGGSRRAVARPRRRRLRRRSSVDSRASFCGILQSTGAVANVPSS